MDQNVERDQRIMWAFGIAAGLVVIGALAPLAFSVGAHSRLSGVAIPFGLAAVAFVVAAFMYQQGRTVAVALYFVAGLAIVYGILPAAGPLITVGAVLAGDAAAREDWLVLSVAIAVIAVGAGSVFAGPSGVWLVDGVGVCAVLVCATLAHVRLRRA